MEVGPYLLQCRAPFLAAPPAFPRQSPQCELIHFVMSDCSFSHSTFPKCQGDSVLGESLLASCCVSLGTLASWWGERVCLDHWGSTPSWAGGTLT